MEAPVEELFNSLKCFECKKYLSILPVKVYPDKSVKCGRCSSGTDAGIDSKVYETIVENLKFPCINRYYECTELLIPKDMKFHEQNCIKSKGRCPICKEQFTDCSLLMVEHFKVKHPERLLNYPSVLLNLNDKAIGGDIIYLCINSTLDRKAKVIRIYYNQRSHCLDVSCGDIGFYIHRFPNLNIELSNMENKIIYNLKAEHKSTSNRYSQIIDFKQFPGSIIICTILFESSDNNQGYQELLSKNSVIRKKIPILVDPVLQAAFSSTESAKTLNMELEFPNIFLLSNEWLKTEFDLAGTSWVFGIQRNLDKNADFLNLNCCLEKKNDPIENKYSFQLNGTIGIRAIEFSTAQEIKIEKAVTSIIFGKRSQESGTQDLRSFILTDVMRWKNGFNPEIADLLKPKYSIKISLNLQLTAIYINE